MWAVDRFRRYGRYSARGFFFWGQSIGIGETNTFQLKLFFNMKIVGATVFGGLWALEWAWQTFFLNHSIGIDETNTFQLKFS